MTDSFGDNSFAGPADFVRGRISGSKWTGGGLSLIRPGPPQGLLVPKLLHLDVEGPALDVTELAVSAGTVGGGCSCDTSRDNLLYVNVWQFPLRFLPILVSVTEGLVTRGTNFTRTGAYVVLGVDLRPDHAQHCLADRTQVLVPETHAALEPHDIFMTAGGGHVVPAQAPHGLGPQVSV